MKIPCLLLRALLIAAPVFAQTQTVPAEAQTTAAEPSGYDLLVQGYEKILPGPNGGASNTEPNISAEENLKRERLAVARNAPALALVRLALQKQIEIPEAVGPIIDFSFNAKARELARQFSQESDVRFADGDYAGAMNSKLDAMELAAAAGHGILSSMLVGAAVESIGASKADKVGAHLDAAQCRAAVARLIKIEERRTTLTETLRQEQKFDLRRELRTLGNPKDLETLKPDEDGGVPTAEDIAQLKLLTPAKITENNARLFDAVVESTHLPYPEAVKNVLPTDLDPWMKRSLSFLEGARYRFSYERIVAQTRLLRAALELRALKLENGVYPEIFTAPVDPFSPEGKALVYRKTNRDYLLYSLGANGKDDGGAKIPTIETAAIKTLSDRIRAESTGDIVQMPF